MIMKVSIQVRS